MKVLIFSDTHGDLRSLEKIVARPADTYIAAGDLSNFGKMLDRCGEILKPLGERLWVLPGNHETHAQTKSFCEKFGFVDFHRQLRKIGDSNWAGLGYSNITPFKTPGEYSEPEISAALSAFDGVSRLHLVVHFPPYDTKLDEYAPRLGRTRKASRPFLRPHSRNGGAGRSARLDEMFQRRQTRLHPGNLEGMFYWRLRKSL